MDPNTIHYFHWKTPAFSPQYFQRWSNWEYLGSKDTIDAYDEVTLHNLKIFFHHDFSEKKLHVIINILKNLGFNLVARYHDRLIFQYEQKQRKDITEPMSPSSTHFLNELTTEIIETAMEQSRLNALRSERRKIITVSPNHHVGAFITYKNSDGWKYHYKRLRVATFWKRYIEKHYKDEITLTPTCYKFIENDILPGGHWITESDGLPMKGLFHTSLPPELIYADTKYLSHSKTMDILNLFPTTNTKRAMLTFVRINEKGCNEKKTQTTRMFTTLSYGEESAHNENIALLHKLKEHLDTYQRRYPGFYNELEISSIYIGSHDSDNTFNYTIEYRIIV